MELNNHAVRCLLSSDFKQALDHFQQALHAASKLLSTSPSIAATSIDSKQRDHKEQNSQANSKQQPHPHLALLQSAHHGLTKTDGDSDGDAAASSHPFHVNGISISHNDAFATPLHVETDHKLCCAIIMFNLVFVNLVIAGLHSYA